MKSLPIFFFLLIQSVANAQEIKIDSTEIEKQLEIKDTTTQVSYQLEEVFITNKAYNFKSDDERKRFMILQKRVMRTYPYAKIAAERLVALNQGMTLLKSEKDKKKYFKIVENYLTNEFEDKLKKLSRNDGKILVKLIHRQTGRTTFDLIHDLKNGWKAFWANNTASLFDINLKSRFEPNNVAEDYLIESILYRSFLDGRLPKQEAKLQFNYNELQKIWREKVKAIREQEAKIKETETNK